MANCNCNSNCNPCPPCEPQFPTTCESLDLTTSAKQLIVQDNAECPTILATPTQAAVPRRGSSTNVEWATGSNGEVLVVKSGQPEFADGSSGDAIQIPSLQANTATNDPRIVTQQTDGTIRHWRPASSTATPRLVYDKNNQWEIDTLNNLLPSSPTPGTAAVIAKNSSGNLVAVTGTSGQFLSINGLDLQFVASAALTQLPPGHLYGLTMTRPTGTSITVAKGVCRDALDTGNIVLPAAITKNIANGAYVVGNNQPGMLDTTTAPTGLASIHVFVITGVAGTDVGFSTNVIPSSLPSGFDKYRRIGSLFMSASVVQDFVQIGDRFMYKGGPLSVSYTIGNPSGGTNFAVLVPSGIKVIPALNVITNGDRYFSLYDLDSSAWPGSRTPGPDNTGSNYVASGEILNNRSIINCNGVGFLYTNTSANIGFDANTATSTIVYVDTWGWIDHRNRLEP